MHNGSTLKDLPVKLAFAAALTLLITFCSALDAEITVPDSINMCENDSYSVLINNSNDYPQENILLDVAIPEGTEYIGASTQIIYPGGSSGSDPTITGLNLSWNLSQIMGRELNASESILLSFRLKTLCEAVSGGRLEAELTSTNDSLSLASESIDVNFPIMKLELTPSVINAHRFDNVTGHVSVENTGTGPMYNVLVNNTPSTGLTLAYSTAGGLNWSYEKLEPGEKRTENLSFIVNSCTNLVNECDATWGCNSTPCASQHAKGSVLFVSKDPNLEYTVTPNPISAPYCGNQTVNVSLSNVGADVSYVMDLSMEFSGMPEDYIISNVSGAVLHTSNSSFYVGNLVPGEEKYFAFDLGLPQGACSPSYGNIAIFPHYTDACGRAWTPPTSLVSYSLAAGSRPELSAAKSGPALLYVGETGTYDLNVSYSAGSCLQNITHDIIVDTYPAGWDVIEDGGGVVNTTSYTITWINQTLEDGSPWQRQIKLRVPPEAQCDCGSSLTNSLSVQAYEDCCGCPLEANASAATVVACYNQSIFSSSKSTSPEPQESCRNTTYRTAYTFNQIGNLTWSDISFTERGGNNQTFPDGGQSGTATFILNSSCITNQSITLGTPISLSFLASCSPLQSGDVLEVYVTLHQPSTGSFAQWSDLCIGPAPSGCPDPCYHDAALVAVGQSDFSLSMDLENIMESCGRYDFVINLQKNGPWNGSNMSLSYNDKNFTYIGPASISGISNYGVPVASFEPVRSGHLLTWYLGDRVSSGGNISFPVVKSCDQERLVAANLSYKDNCGAPLNGSFSGEPLILNKGSLYIDKTPELIFATKRNVLWKVYLSNKGSGTTYNTSITDMLDPGLIYTGSRINGVTDPANTTVSGQNITWSLGNLSPKKQMIIELNASLNACRNMDNHVLAAWGCSGIPCQSLDDDSTVVGLTPSIVLSKHDAGVIDDCGANASFTIQFGVTDAYAYNLSASELLPAGLKYVPGSYDVSGAVPTSVDLGANPLRWHFNSSAGYAPGTRITITFNATVTGPCSFSSGSARAVVNYINPCGSQAASTPRSVALQRSRSGLTISKAPARQWVEKDGIVTWNILLSSSGPHTARNITLSDILPSNTVYDAGSSSPPASSGLGTVASPLVWNLADMPRFSTRTIVVAAKVANCTVETANNATVSWSCCVRQSATATATLRSLPEISLSKSSGFIDTCGGDYTIVISNSGTSARTPRIHDILPQGFLYKSGSAGISSNNASHQAFLAALPDEPLDLSSTNRSIIWNASSIDRIYRNETITIGFSTESCSGCCDHVVLPAKNTAFFNYSDSCGNPYSRQFDLAVSPKLAQLQVKKTPLSQTGATARWTIAVSNSGNMTANNVTVTDILEPGLTAPAVTPAGSTIYPNQPAAGYTTIVWSGLNLPVGSNVFVGSIRATAIPSGGLVNNVSVKGVCPSGCVYSQSGDLAVASRINISKSDAPDESIGDYANFTIEVDYWGSGESYNRSRIIDTLPVGLKYSSHSCSGCGSFSQSGKNLTWDLGNFTGPRRIVINLSTIVEDVISNQNAVRLMNLVQSVHESPQGIPFSASDNANVTLREPDMALTKTVNKTANLQFGDILKYTLTASHTPSSTWPAYDLNVTDVMPAGVSFLSYTSNPAPNATSFSGQNLRWYYQSLPASQSVTIEYLARVSGPVIMGGPLKNDGRVNWTSTRGANPDERSGRETGLDDYNRRANVTSAVTDQATISKSPTGADLVRTIGETVQYTITADLPLATARSVWINDSLPAGLRYENSTLVVSGSGSLKSVLVSGTGPTDIKWGFGDVNNSLNQDITIRFNATVQDIITSQEGTLLSPNSVTLSWLNYASTRKTTPAATSAPVLIREPDLQISKSANRTEAHSGDTIGYTLTATNGPPSSLPAYDVVIADKVPPEMALQSYSSAPPANVTSVLGQIISWRYDRIPLAGSVTMSYNATLIGSLMVNDTVRNNATINWTSTAGINPDERHGAWTALDDYNKGTHADVRVDSPTGMLKLPHEPRNASIGLQSNYTLVLRLPKAKVGQLWVNDTIPVGLIYDNSTLQISGAASAVLLPVTVAPPNDGTTTTLVQMYLGDVDNAGGLNVTIRFNATVADTPENRAGGIIEENWASMTWKDFSGGLRTSSGSSGILNLPAITVRKSALLPPDYPNSNVTFIINVTNTGKTVLNPIRISDILPYGMEHVSDNMSAIVSGRAVSAVVPGILYPGQSLYREIVARFDGKSYSGFVNQVNATGTPPVGKDVWDLDQIALPDITSSIKMVKTANNTSPLRNENVSYNITVTNTGNLTQETVRVVDYLPPEMELLSTSPPATVGASTVIWENVGPLGAMQSVNLTMIMRLR